MTLDEQIRCKVWAGERNNNTKTITYNHAYLYDLNGNEYPKNKIISVLLEKSKPPYAWELRACKPLDNLQQCKGCAYENLPKENPCSSNTYGSNLSFNFANAGKPDIKKEKV